MKKWVMVLALALPFVLAFQASATVITFNRITSNSDINIESQLFIDVIVNGSGVKFKFRNAGTVLSSISEIYFYDGVLLDMWSIEDSCQGVNFEDLGQNTSPNKLPGYSPDKNVLVVLSATEAEGPEPANGVKPNDWLSIGYTFKNGKNFQNLLDDLASGEVVIGIHVKAIDCAVTDPDASTMSDSFVSNPLPEPMTMALLALGGLMLRRKK